MNIDTGLAAVIVAVLVFYLRLIVIQRESARRIRQSLQTPPKKGRKNKPAQPRPTPSYSIISKNKLDWAIAGLGLALVLVGLSANAGWIGLALLRAYWWAPTSLGIVAFSWIFKLPK